MSDKRLDNLSAVIREWIEFSNGWFSSRQIDNDINIQTSAAKTLRRVVLKTLCDSGKLVRAPDRDGVYRKPDNLLKEMHWQAADPGKIVPLKFPFGLEEHCRIYPKSIVIVAGSKNTGKTAYLYNFIQMNMADFCIDLFNSETGPEQMLERFSPLDIPNPAPFDVFERYDNFADVINPDHISVIDYLDLNSEVYLVGSEIDAIFRKLNKGVVIIGLQKPPPTTVYTRGVPKIYERDLAYGGGFSAKRAVLYISMGANKLKLVYVKTPRNPKVNPNNMTFTFNIGENGVTFENIQRSYGNELE